MAAEKPYFREQLIQSIVDECVEYAHQKIWHGGLTGAEARLAWLMVVDNLLQSAVIDRQASVNAERLLGHSVPRDAQ